MIDFSIIVPVYNRADEIKELFDSLALQRLKIFEVIVVEDGSGDSKDLVKSYEKSFPIQYFFQKETSVSFRRNFGVKNAKSNFFIFFDSDCIIPPDYFEKLRNIATKGSFDAYGGRDAAMSTFTPFQQAVNYAMTSFLTTGGVRGNKKKIDKFYPRSFNMGFTKEVFEKTGGFPEDITPPGEDMILSIKIHESNFNVHSEPDLYVYHKRKVSVKRFWKQIYSFAYVRLKISFMYPSTFKIFYLLPIAFVLYNITSIIFAIYVSILPFLALFLYIILIFVDALFKTKCIGIAMLSICTSILQFWAYGIGLSVAFFNRLFKKKI